MSIQEYTDGKTTGHRHSGTGAEVYSTIHALVCDRAEQLLNHEVEALTVQHVEHP